MEDSLILENHNLHFFLLSQQVLKGINDLHLSEEHLERVGLPISAGTLVSSSVMAVLYHFSASLTFPCKIIWYPSSVANSDC